MAALADHLVLDDLDNLLALVRYAVGMASLERREQFVAMAPLPTPRPALYRGAPVEVVAVALAPGGHARAVGLDARCRPVVLEDVEELDAWPGRPPAPVAAAARPPGVSRRRRR